jgi:hypothetical protein
MAEIHLLLNHPEQALACVERARELAPGNSAVARALAHAREAARVSGVRA